MSLLETKRKRDTKAQRGQFLAVSVTIALGVLLFASTYDAYRNLDGSYNMTYDRLAFADITAVGVDAGFADTVSQIDGVERAEARVQADLPMRVTPDDTFLGRVIGYPAGDQPEVNKIDVIDGAYLDPDDDSAVVIESHMAEQFDIGVGDTIEIFSGSSWQQATVIGVAVSAEYIWPARDNQDIFPSPGTFGVVFISSNLVEGLPAQAERTDVNITYSQDADTVVTDSLVESAARDAGAADVIPRADQASNSTLLLDVNGFQSMSIMFPVLFMAAAGMAAYVLLTRIVFAQEGVIGTLRASGMSRRRISRHFLSYGLRLGVVAGAIGLALGIISAYAITGVYTAQLDIPDTVRSFHWITPIVGMAFAILAGALGAWAPARRAMAIAPAEAMRGATPAGPGRVSWFERALPPLRRLPTRWLMILRGLGRNKRRSFATILGVVLGLILIMVSWGMIDSVLVMLDRQFEEVSLQDADVVMSSQVSQGSIDEMEALPGILAAEIVSSANATATLGDGSFDTSLVGYDPGTVMHGFPDGLPTTGVLAGNGLISQLDIRVGDRVSISLPDLDIAFDADLVGFLDEPVGTVLYMDRASFADVVGQADVAEPTVSHIQVKFDDQPSRETIIREIRELDDVALVSDARTLYNTLQDYLGFFYVFVGVMLLLGGAMSFALMYNSISVNVAERVTEFADMRANGLSHSAVARLIGFENILLTLMGVIPGAILGWVVGYLFMRQFSVDAFTLEFVMRPLSIVISVLALIAVAALSLIPAIRKVRRIDIGATVRQRAI